MDTQNNLSNKKTLKVIATFKSVDYSGKVKTTEITREIPWTIDSKKFLKYGITNGSYRGYDKPFNGYFNDLMREYFGIAYHEKVWRPFSVESEPVGGVAKFIFQRHNVGHQIMQWEDISN